MKRHATPTWSLADLSPLELRRKITTKEAAELNGVSEDMFKRHYRHLIRRIGPRRLTYNRFDTSPSHRAKLLVVMSFLPEIEAWRATLTPRQRARMNHPGAVLLNYRRATSIKSAPEPVSSDVLVWPAP